MWRAWPPSPNGMLNLSCATCSPPSSAARRNDSTGWTASRASSSDRSLRFFSHIALPPSLSRSGSRYQPRCTAIPVCQKDTACHVPTHHPTPQHLPNPTGREHAVYSEAPEAHWRLGGGLPVRQLREDNGGRSIELIPIIPTVSLT